MPIYWGDLHNHCGITYGFGGLNHALTAAREQLDFCAIIGHAMWPDMPGRTKEMEFTIDFHLKGFQKLREGWEDVRNTVAQANREGEFVTFQGYEIHSSRYGDHHIISTDDQLPLIEADTPAELAIKLREGGRQAIAVPHHIAYAPEYRAIDWDAYQEELSPIVEIFSKHGCGLSEDSPFAYYHTMGPRDSRSTGYAGLRAGHRFGFAGSTDHHAGYPGSYGDGRVAVHAEAKTREAIWDALLRRETYAVSGDKIECAWTGNGVPMGGETSREGAREFQLSVKGWDSLERIAVYKNLLPWKVWTDGDVQKEPNQTGRYRLRVEMGWGRSSKGYFWQGGLTVAGGRITASESGFRGVSILRPDPSIADDDNMNNLNNHMHRISEERLEWTCTTFKNPSPQQQGTAQVMLEVEGDESTRIKLENNGKLVEVSIRDLLAGNRAYQMNPNYHGEAFLIHRAVPAHEYTFQKAFTDSGSDRDFYHVEIKQKNGQAAWVSPIYFV